MMIWHSGKPTLARRNHERRRVEYKLQGRPILKECPPTALTKEGQQKRQETREAKKGQSAKTIFLPRDQIRASFTNFVSRGRLRDMTRSCSALTSKSKPNPADGGPLGQIDRNKADFRQVLSTQKERYEIDGTIVGGWELAAVRIVFS